MPFSPTQSPLQGAGFTQSSLNFFIPELWMDEVIRARNAKMMMLEYVKRIPDSMKKGDVLHVPRVGRLSVNYKRPEQPVTLQTNGPTEFTMRVDRYMESSFMIEDIAAIQEDYDARSIYTEEAGLALARDIDHWILSHRLGIKKAGQVIQSRNAANTADDVLNRAAILAARLRLLQANVPLEDIVLHVSPAQYTSLLNVDGFINGFYVDGKPTTTGRVGELFGIPVIENNHILKNANANFRIGDSGATGPTPGVAFWNGTAAVYSDYYPDQTKFVDPTHGGQEATMTAPTAGTPGDTLAINQYSAIMCHKDWLAFWMQQEPKIESSREVLYQGDAVVCTQYYGAKTFRSDCAIVIESNEAA
jgi:N4-gp56 family major capsid protein